MEGGGVQGGGPLNIIDLRYDRSRAKRSFFTVQFFLSRYHGDAGNKYKKTESRLPD